MSFINLQVGEIPKILPPSFVRNLLGPGELFACSFPENENSASFESIVRVRSLVDRQLGLLNGDLKPEVGNSSVADSLSKSNHQIYETLRRKFVLQYH